MYFLNIVSIGPSEKKIYSLSPNSKKKKILKHSNVQGWAQKGPKRPHGNPLKNGPLSENVMKEYSFKLSTLQDIIENCVAKFLGHELTF